MKTTIFSGDVSTQPRRLSKPAQSIEVRLTAPKDSDYITIDLHREREQDLNLLLSSNATAADMKSLSDTLSHLIRLKDLRIAQLEVELSELEARLAQA